MTRLRAARTALADFAADLLDAVAYVVVGWALDPDLFESIGDRPEPTLRSL